MTNRSQASGCLGQPDVGDPVGEEIENNSYFGVVTDRSNLLNPRRKLPLFAQLGYLRIDATSDLVNLHSAIRL